MKLYKFLGYSALVTFTLCLLNQDIPASLSANNPVRLNVIPQPRQILTTPKSPPCVLNNEWTVFVESTADETTRLAAELIVQDLDAIWGLKMPLLINDKTLSSAEKSIILGIPKRDKKIDAIATRQAIALNQDLHSQGYKISITSDSPGPGKILLLANTSQGLFYAAQTFRQLLTKDTANQIILPPAQINDWPLFDYRGVQINISDGIKIDYLKNLIHLFAYYKINILALQTSSLTMEQITELTKESSAYQIDLAVNISMITPGSTHHICPDKARCGHLHKKPLGWIDSVLKEQRFLSKIPKTTVVMNTLEPDSNLTIGGYFEQIESFRKEGLEQILCPRITINGDILPDILNIRKNIYTASQAGLRHLDNNRHIMGLMLCGPLNKTTTFTETIIEPLAFTAECGWIPDRADADKFNSHLTHSLFGINGNEAAEIAHLLSSCNQLIKVGNLSDYICADPFKNEIHLDTPNFYGSLQEIKSLSEEAQKKIASLQERSLRPQEILGAWRYAARQWQAFAEQFLAARGINNKYQDFYDNKYVFEYAPIKANYQAIQKEYEELFDKAFKELDALEKEYKTLINQRYDIAEAKAIEPFEAAKTIWQDKKNKVSEAILSSGFPSPEKLGISLAQLPQRLVMPELKPPSAEMEKTFTWWDRRLSYRVLVTMKNTVARPAIGPELFAYPIEIKLNFTELLKESGFSAADIINTEFTPQSVRVIEYSNEGTPIAEVPYQMDKTKYFDRFNAEVNLAWITRKPLEAKTTKYFYVYFDTAKSPAPKYDMKYPYGGLSASGTDKKGFWLKNGRLKIGINAPPAKKNTLNRSLINSWVVRDFSTGFFTHLNLAESEKQGFGDIQGVSPAGGLSLQNPANGPLVARFHANSKEGDGYIFNFYENLPICEVFTDSRINEFHNSYLIPQSYLAAALKDKMSAFAGAEYLSSSYNKGKILPEKQLAVSLNESFWLAQKIVKGLTIASITPEKPVTHYLKATPDDSNISILSGVAGDKPLHHFIIYADITQQDTFELMSQIKNIFTLDNPPNIQRGRAERLSQ